MNKLYNILFLVFLLSYCNCSLAQWGVGAYVGVMNAFKVNIYIFKYPVLPLNPIALGNKWFILNSAFPTSPYNTRSMYGSGIFMQNTDLTSQNSQKFMQFRNSYYCTANANTLRIAWRYNATGDNLYEVGLYSHKNHTSDAFFCGGPSINGREVAYTSFRVKKNNFFRYQLIFGKYKSGVRIWFNGQDETIMIWRKSNNSTWPNNISLTNAEASVYFKADSLTITNRKFMSIFSSAITVPVYLEFSYYHQNLHLLNCLFTAQDNPTLSATNRIIAPIKNEVGINNYQNTSPNPNYVQPYCVVEPNANVEFKAKNYIELREGFNAQSGSKWKAGQ